MVGPLRPRASKVTRGSRGPTGASRGRRFPGSGRPVGLACSFGPGRRGTVGPCRLRLFPRGTRCARIRLRGLAGLLLLALGVTEPGPGGGRTAAPLCRRIRRAGELRPRRGTLPPRLVERREVRRRDRPPRGAGGDGATGTGWTVGSTRADASALGCRWPAALTLALPASGGAGLWVNFRARDGGGRFQSGRARRRERVASCCVRRSRERRQRSPPPSFRPTPTTPQRMRGGYDLYAYHGRGGNQGHRVSIERPPASQFSPTGSGR